MDGQRLVGGREPSFGLAKGKAGDVFAAPSQVTWVGYPGQGGPTEYGGLDPGPPRLEN